jgi:hypothetical protein
MRSRLIIETELLVLCTNAGVLPGAYLEQGGMAATLVQIRKECWLSWSLGMLGRSRLVDGLVRRDVVNIAFAGWNPCAMWCS